MTTPPNIPAGPGAAGFPQAPSATPMIVPPELVPPVRGVTAFLSAQTRAGDWILARLFRAVSFWGSVTIDLTSARFGAGASRIEVVAIMGSVEVFVPPDVRVECDGDAFMGSFEIHGQKSSKPSVDAPTIHVTGNAYLGSVEVKVIDPNAPSWIETMRTRWKQLRGNTADER